MCGIVGLISKDKHGLGFKHRDIFEQMLVLDQVRGMDGTGAFGVFLNQQASLIKVGTNASNLVSLVEWEKFKTKITSFKFLVGHNRKATQGKISSKNSHPFHEKNIVLVHNGTLMQHKNLDAIAEVDSQAIAIALNKDIPEKIIPEIEGAFTLVWFDKSTKLLNIIRNEERPLWLAETNDTWMYASEPWMITSVCLRENEKILDMHSVPPHTLLQFKNGNEYDIKENIKRKYQTVISNYPYTNTNTYQKPNNFWKGVYYDDVTGEVDSIEFELEPRPKEKETTNVVPFTSTSNSSFLKKGAEVSFLIKTMAKQPIKSPAGVSTPLNGIFITGEIPYLKAYPKVDITALAPFTDDAGAIDALTIRDHNGHSWLTGTVLDSGVSVNGGPWAKLDKVFSSSFIQTWNKTKVPVPLWNSVCADHMCDKCFSKIESKEAEYTSVNIKSGSIFKVTCADCVEKSLPKEKQNEFTEARIDALSKQFFLSEEPINTMH